MKIILFEGIAGSGKTTIERLLLEKLQNAEILFEDETLIPLMENRDSRFALEHLQKLLISIESRNVDVLIVDRLHLTHAFRTNSDLKVFSVIENNLQKIGETVLILLTTDPSKIRDRLEETIAIRKDGWKLAKQGSVDERTTYYIGQQEKLKRLFESSLLPKITIDTTSKDWSVYVEQIFAFFKAA